MKSPEKILFGEGCQSVNLNQMAPVVGCSEAALRKWKSGVFPKAFIVLARICNIRNMTNEQIGALVRSFAK